MSEITKVNPCNRCWQPVAALPTPIGDQYSCENCHGGEPGGYDLSQWNDENPLPENPLSKANPEPMPKCCCGAEWEPPLTRHGGTYYTHPISSKCMIKNFIYTEAQIRFLFGSGNLRVKELEAECDKLRAKYDECVSLSNSQYDENKALQAKLDAIPSERFTSPVAYENLARRYALACRIIRAFTDIVLEHDD